MGLCILTTLKCVCSKKVYNFIIKILWELDGVQKAARKGSAHPAYGQRCRFWCIFYSEFPNSHQKVWMVIRTFSNDIYSANKIKKN